ncbi:uncharacterized protein TRUGW13939_11995 [Talaromyces rugulosus]|uniref:Uncharacterized protein n=1 Tax=Talaromyces rugulosus TaxID=121627 RepID=A0A7H8REA7_TALRU|nr:uncharacterized protein TRUGW13939_11995 [Talaromyces rugulosus]QKX64819.1 hypothetical protein TRUGW13939_11995 [Talaromyces rugulosus]
MAPSTFILTSSPFVPSQIALASFVPNIRHPHQDAKKPYAVTAVDYTSQPDDDFDGLINTGSKSFLSIFATRLAGLSLQSDQSSMLHVTAKKGNIYSLNSPNSLFEDIVSGHDQGEDMQKWFELCKRRGIKPRFVVAYRTFVDARVSRDHHRATDVSGTGTVPISTLQGDMSAMADIRLQAGHRTNTDAKGDMKTPGERVYAVCYRKVSISRHQGRLAPLLEQTNKWEPFAAARGEPEEEYFQADLFDGDDADGCDIHEFETHEGRKICFGYPSELVSDEEDDEEDDE